MVRLLAVDVNVSDLIASKIEARQIIRVLGYSRTRRRVDKILFVRKVNRRSMKIHRRPATSWLRYAKNLEDDWVNKSVALVKRLSAGVDAIVMEDLDAGRLRAKLKSRDPGRAMLFSTWPIAKLLRRIRRVAEKTGKLITIPPHYTSTICPICNELMTHEAGRWDRLACRRCGFRDDRDHIAVRNIARTALVLNSFHYLDTHLGRQLREYKQALDSHTTAIEKALAQGPENKGPLLGGKGEATPPSTPRKRDLGAYLGGGC
ncbi:MAG: zinc ribbon domain-containing protein [Aigarchaeota archaeon]|nr:zinc ribbon domain-containing protein [Candidatus Pelearchaeum maunauluense]